MNTISTFLIKNDASFHQVANKDSDKILNAINLMVKAYPEYLPYYDKSKTIDSISEIALKNLKTIDLKIQNDYIINNFLNTNSEEQIKPLTHGIHYFSKDELVRKRLHDWTLNLLKSTMVQKRKRILFNYYATNINTHQFWNPLTPMLINSSINALKGEKYEFQIGLSKNNNDLENVKFWINEDEFETKKNKTYYKKETTKSGWNDLKIKYEGEYQNKFFTDSLTYRYYVCD